LDFYKIFTPSNTNKLVISQKQNLKLKSRIEDENESKFASSMNSKGFEEIKFSNALKNKRFGCEEVKNSNFSPNSNCKSPQASKNITNSLNVENSFLNFLENNSFVKMNKKILKNEKPNKELIIPITKKQTNIQKELIFNENQIVLNHQKIDDLNPG